MYNILDPCSKIFFGTDCCIGAICRGCYNLAIFFAAYIACCKKIVQGCASVFVSNNISLFV